MVQLRVIGCSCFVLLLIFELIYFLLAIKLFWLLLSRLLLHQLLLHLLLSRQKHSITVTEKTVTLINRVLIGRHHFIVTRKGTNQH